MRKVFFVGLVTALSLACSCRRDSAMHEGTTKIAPPTLPAESASAVSLSRLLSSPDAGDGAAHARARKAEAAKAGERITVPGGTFRAGSLPGDDGRDPRLEPTSLEATLSPFEMDRLFYPNDPAEPPRTDVSVKEAAKLCAARGERLCTELEWEYACKGGRGDVYPTGGAWDTGCEREPHACSSENGVLGFGAIREWTSSEVLPLDRDDRPLAAVRGAARGAAATDHRCAHRTGTSATNHGKDIGFRCCAGPVNAATIPAPKLGVAVRKIALDPKELAKILAPVPQLSSIGQDIRYFSEPDDTATVLRRGRTEKAAATDTEGFTLTTSPLSWNPAPGEEVIVALGRGGKDSFIVALYHLPDNSYRLASSLLLVNDPGPFALAYNNNVRERLIWTSCWKCTGEGGTVSLRDGRRIIIVQQ